MKKVHFPRHGDTKILNETRVDVVVHSGTTKELSTIVFVIDVAQARNDVTDAHKEKRKKDFTTCI